MFCQKSEETPLVNHQYFIISNIFDDFTRFGKFGRTLFLKKATFVSIFSLSRFIQFCTKLASNARKFFFLTNTLKKVWKNLIRTTYDVKVQSCFSPIFSAETLFLCRTILVEYLVVWLMLNLSSKKFKTLVCLINHNSLISSQ